VLRRARGQLKGPVALTGALAGVVALAACSRPAEGVPAAGPVATTAAADAAPASSRATGAPAPAPAPATAAAPVAAGSPARSGPATDATCTTAPLGVHVVGVRRESGDSIRVELTLTNLAAADTWRAGSPEEAAVHAAVAAIEEASVLSADGRRRLFALHDSSGLRVGSPATAPVPGHPQSFWTLFPAADGPVSLILPGFAPLAGLPVVAPPARPAP
jgi:hypothetical protein